MSIDATALRLVDVIYRAASEPAHWLEFVRMLSDALGGASIALGMYLGLSVESRHCFSARLSETIGADLLMQFVSNALGDPATRDRFSNRFESMQFAFPNQTVEVSSRFLEGLEGHGLAPEWPMANVLAVSGDHAPMVIAAFRRRGGAGFGPEDFALANELVPHLSRACEIYSQLSGIYRNRRSLEEVIDRLQIAVILTDIRGRPVLMNRSAQALIDRGGVVRLENGRVRARSDTDDERVQSAIHEAASADVWSAIRLGDGNASAESLQVLINPLEAARRGSQARDAVAALFLAGPQTSPGLPLEYLKRLYDLTISESELLESLARGMTLATAAANRGVSLNTARSHLKQIFVKTGTRRQSEVIQLVLTGQSSVREN